MEYIQILVAIIFLLVVGLGIVLGVLYLISAIYDYLSPSDKYNRDDF